MVNSDDGVLEMQVDAFVFNKAVCTGENYRIAPITQPNYSFLSFDKDIVRNDVLDPVELQNAQPWGNNARLVDLGTGEIRKKRLGVYVHWILPTMYRTGTASTDSPTSPAYKPVPNRWLVVRKLDMSSVIPAEAADTIPELEGWVVESDRRRGVDDLGDDIDTQVDVSSYVSTDETSNQGRYFIGKKTPASTWKEDPTADYVDGLNVLSSSNQLFADYQPHNNNVFSIIDNFAYGDDKYLEAAEASYFVLGWHASAQQDPLRSPSGIPMTFQERLEKLRLHLRHEFPRERLERSASDSDAATFCCGAIKDVLWNVNEAPAKVPAETAGEVFKTTMPIAISTNPLEALVTYIQGHERAEELTPVEQLIKKIQTLLLNQDDGVDAQLEAEDMLTNNDYERYEGGSHFYLSGQNDDEEAPLQPAPDQLVLLAKLNALQLRLDTLQRLLPQLRWDMFAEWWKYVCSRDAGPHPEITRQKIEAMTTRLQGLVGDGTDPGSIADMALQVDFTKTEISYAEPGTSTRFFQQRDPTMLIAGMESGWPKDHLEESKMAMSGFLTTPTAPPEFFSGNSGAEDLVAVLPLELRATATSLLNSFLIALSASSQDDTGPTITPRSWDNTQPWCPLFLEYEIEYFHIPIENWSLEERITESTPKPIPKLRYGIKKDIDLASMPELQNDKRVISGRVLLLPQPAFSLTAKVNQLFTSLSEDELNEYLTEGERDQLLELLNESCPYMSCPLSSITEHLLTIVQGTHVKPNSTEPGASSAVPIEEAKDIATEIGIEAEQLVLVDQETGPTPYANQVRGLADGYSPCKPATHGQFRFTKINIIDKFGQAISVIDPSPAAHPPPIYPNIGDFYACQTRPDKPDEANTVYPDANGNCEFIQLLPHINQPSRLNSAFVVRDDSESKWRPATEWENPIFGWLVVNYADQGLQIFLPDGRFYREVRLGGIEGTALSQPWLPFGRPDTGIPDTKELDVLISQLNEPDDLKTFFDMVQKAYANQNSAPDSYAEFLSAIVGKPMALVNMGWSMELGTEPPKNHSTINTTEPDDIFTYNFPIKFGDQARVYDGLIGYYPPSTTQGPGTIFTHFPSGGRTAAIDNTNYPDLTAFYLDPTTTVDPEALVSQRNEKWLVRTAILDPFIPVHGYTGVLPIEELKLPNWTVETALNRITAFFHLGPLLVSKDVPAYESTYELKQDYDLTDESKYQEFPGAGLAIPALTITDWSWLQPYVVQDGGEEKSKFMGLKLMKLDNKPRWEQAPYTAVEGYLQLKRPVGKEDVDPE